MHKSTLKSLVIKEAKALKSNATKDELANLNFGRLNPTEHTQCIYGQMTGSCFSPRAEKLIFECATKFIDGSIDEEVSDVKECRTVDIENGRRDKRSGDVYFSPIEMFIAQNNENDNKILINFLSGKIKTLKFP